MHLADILTVVYLVHKGGKPGPGKDSVFQLAKKMHGSYQCRINVGLAAVQCVQLVDIH